MKKSWKTHSNIVFIIFIIIYNILKQQFSLNLKQQKGIYCNITICDAIM